MNRNNNKAIRNIKPCKFGCGKWIAWNTHQNKFIEADTGEKHICLKLKPKGEQQQQNLQHNTNILTAKEQVHYLDTVGPLLAEILVLLEELMAILKKRKKKRDLSGI